MAGFDCSGFCIEVLKSVGLLPRKGDWTAHGLWHIFKTVYTATDSGHGDSHSSERPVEEMEEGCLVFWHSKHDSDRIVHVEYALNKRLTIGASGGGSANVDLDTAIQRNAYVKIRPVRPTYIHGLLYPFDNIPLENENTD